MKPNLPIALGAGLIAAVVFASATIGPTESRLLLLCVAGLPVALAGFSYNANTAFLAASIATLLVGLIASIPAAVAFGLAIVFPPALLVRLALLNRETAAPPGQVEWYPLGRVLLAATVMSGTLVATAFLLATGDTDRLRTAVRAAVDQMVKRGFAGMPGGAPLGEGDLVKLTDMMVMLLPGVSAVMWLAITLVGLWLSARVALASGQLARPWPDLAAFSLPPGTPLLLAAALAGSLLLEALPRLGALAFAGALYALYVLLGLAIIHYNTRGLSWRGPALAALYFLLIVMNSGASLLVALLGLADSFIPMRRPPPNEA